MQLDLQTIRQYERLDEVEAIRRIKALREARAGEIVLLAHLYQRRAITELADFVGDSFGLAQSAARAQGKYIVFAGVRFMAESAAILCRPDQKVLHPDPDAGCPMADMAAMGQVQTAWRAITGGRPPIPVTYMNSTADIKAFCGANGGTVCTSSNAEATFKWAFEQSDRIFFLPDEHLGRNTALKFGIDPQDIAVWDPEAEGGGEADAYADAKVILWRGYCPVHQKFTVRDIEHVRRFYPKAKVVVHPECPQEVVAAADAVGSTEFIRRYVADTQSGDQVFIGTEINLVQNLQAQYPDRLISRLHRSLCLTMYQITLGRLLYTLENLGSFPVVELDADTRRNALVALERMLSLFPKGAHPLLRKR